MLSRFSTKTATSLATTILAMVLPACLAAVPATAADIATGQRIFAKCRICHSVAAGAPSTVGPNLHGLFGRKAGSMPGFAYSAAMKTPGIIWDDANLAKFLHDPKTFIPGNRMAFPGIENDADLADLIAYLKQATK